MKRTVLAILTIFLGASLLSAQEGDFIDENALFEDTTSVESNMNSNVNVPMEKEEFVFSGDFLSTIGYSLNRSWILGDTPGDTNKFSAGIRGNFNLDLRLRKGFKGHMGILVDYSTAKAKSYLALTNDLDIVNTMLLARDTEISFPEFFVDMNIQQKVFFRFGKQVIQWGRGVLWNPTDLINIDRVSFADDFQVRSGVPGFKIHVPFGTVVNLYTFLDISDTETIQDVAIAGKVEFLLGRTEIGISGWAKQDKLPVYGVDFSSRIGLFDIYGEASLSEGENRLQLDPVVVGTNTFYSMAQDTSNFVTRITLGLRRSFHLVYDDRIMIGAEFYYNSSGYDENIFEDPAKINVLFMSYQYRPYDTSRYYGSLYLNVNQLFLNQDLSWTLNGLGNFVDNSYVLSSALYYAPLFNLQMGLTINAFIGPEKAEFTQRDQGAGISFTTQYKF